MRISFFVISIWILLSALIPYSGTAQESPHRKIAFACAECHRESGWHQVQFDHSRTAFILEGQHRMLRCEHCHQIADFSQVGKSCISCHTDVHRTRVGRDCGRCHSPVNWLVIDLQKAHRETTFPFIGGHANLDCKACHKGSIEGEFTMLESSCFRCHEDNFLHTQNPRHTGLDFSVSCESCHTPFSWRPADFKQHESRFRIYSGEHAGKWQNCTTCHYIEGQYAAFSCYLYCHEHNQGDTDRKHREVSGYVYDSYECYRCHAGGKKDEGE